MFQIVFCVPLTYSKPFVFYCRFPYFKAPKDAIGLFIYSMAHSKTAISPKNSSSFYRQTVLESKIWTLGLLIWESLLLCSFQWTELGNICTYPNGNPLQCSCLENPRDRGAWWDAVYGVTQSQTQLKWLSLAYPHSCVNMHIYCYSCLGMGHGVYK